MANFKPVSNKPLSDKQLIAHALAVTKIILEKDTDISILTRVGEESVSLTTSEGILGYSVLEPVAQYFIRKGITWDLSSDNNKFQFIIYNH